MHIPAPIFRCANRPDFKVRVVGYIIQWKPWNMKGCLYGAVLKKLEVRTTMNHEETEDTVMWYHQAPARTSVIIYIHWFSRCQEIRNWVWQAYWFVVIVGGSSASKRDYCENSHSLKSLCIQTKSINRKTIEWKWARKKRMRIMCQVVVSSLNRSSSVFNLCWWFCHQQWFWPSVHLTGLDSDD